jgi:hypothetical protein
MGVVFTQESNYAKEMRKWEAHHTQFGAPQRPYEFQEFPQMLYKADRDQSGAIVIAETCIVRDDDERRNMQSRGFYLQQADALQAAEKLYHVEYGTLAAERNFEIERGRISANAAAEVRAAEAAHGASHLPMVPIAPKKRGRKPKVQNSDTVPAA